MAIHQHAKEVQDQKYVFLAVYSTEPDLGIQVPRSRAVLPDEQEQSSNSRTLIIFSTGSRGATPYGTFFLLTSRSSGGSMGRRAAAAPAVGEKQPHGRAGRGEAAARARAED
ncbi:hypothetical protein VPH35_058357 [Triticum aestivum]